MDYFREGFAVAAILQVKIDLCIVREERGRCQIIVYIVLMCKGEVTQIIKLLSQTAIGGVDELILESWKTTPGRLNSSEEQ